MLQSLLALCLHRRRSSSGCLLPLLLHLRRLSLSSIILQHDLVNAAVRQLCTHAGQAPLHQTRGQQHPAIRLGNEQSRTTSQCLYPPAITESVFRKWESANCTGILQAVNTHALGSPAQDATRDLTPAQCTMWKRGTCEVSMQHCAAGGCAKHPYLPGPVNSPVGHVGRRFSVGQRHLELTQGLWRQEEQSSN